MPVKKHFWKDEYYVRVYKLARAGASNRAIARDLDISDDLFIKWKDEKPAMAKALEEGREQVGDKTSGFERYVYGLLPRRAQEVWDSLEEANEIPDRRMKRQARNVVHKLLENKGTKFRQQLYVHALVHCKFSMSAAAQMTGIPIATVKNWMYKDDGFNELIRGVNDVKKDFVEGSLMTLVAEGDTTATIFASKTLNKDRGYADKNTLRVNGKFIHEHKVGVPVEEALDELDVTDRRKILEAIRRVEGKKKAAAPQVGYDDPNVRDAEFEEVRR